MNRRTRSSSAIAVVPEDSSSGMESDLFRCLSTSQITIKTQPTKMPVPMNSQPMNPSHRSDIAVYAGAAASGGQ
jgi:hypothetical protein